MRNGKEVALRDIHGSGNGSCVEDGCGAVGGRDSLAPGLATGFSGGTAGAVRTENGGTKQSFAMIKRNYMTKVVVA
jgi:hypothetical protein